MFDLSHPAIQEFHACRLSSGYDVWVRRITPCGEELQEVFFELVPPNPQADRFRLDVRLPQADFGSEKFVRRIALLMESGIAGELTCKMCQGRVALDFVLHSTLVYCETCGVEVAEIVNPESLERWRQLIANLQ